MNRSEAFVFGVCRQSFLSLWTYAQPKGKHGKELCDALVVCDPDVIIISVKESDVTDSGDESVDWQRWRKRAIQKSSGTIYGAERWLRTASNVIRSDGEPGLPLPAVADRRVHRVAVALGAEGKVPIEFGDLGKGFVHVLDDRSFGIILSELDTISDFVGYLLAKEGLFEAGTQAMMGGEEDLLALYLHSGRKFPETDLIMLQDDLWEEFVKKPEYRAKVDADKASYAWDRLIEIVARDVLCGNLEFGGSLTQSDIVLRTMARENRFSRRILGKQFNDFLQRSREGAFARVTPSHSGVLYVFLAFPRDADRNLRVAEIRDRCFVARGLYADADTVLGIATEQYDSAGFSLDVCYLRIEDWTEQDQEHASAMQQELGYFVSPTERRVQEDEYPTS